MAGDFCRGKDEWGWGCIQAAGHVPPCVFRVLRLKTEPKIKLVQRAEYVRPAFISTPPKP